ncbi:alkylglycerol monooxygenase-like [Oppia nitens]|uniref:alkylglycerol monooxygenase-like n=1 Tax=Oppia nitens TaxID=1686743 RepID=UPI0023DACAE8|nr:alkylglycerol monooxygenase-like [Oppia nitens]
MINISETLATLANSSPLAKTSVEHLHTCGQRLLDGGIEQLGWMFYLISPNKSLFNTPHEVPNYEVQIFPIFTLFMVIEQIIRFFQRKRASRVTDILINLGAGLLFVVARVLLLGTVLSIFYFLYDNYRIVDLPPTCISTWFLSLLLIEFVYYWVHRSLHEINIFWASHQFHHNAVDIDVSTTLRDTLIDLVIYEFFPIPLALIIPPPILLVHMQFSLIYQVWLHTEIVSHLGPLEYIINTPRQHRVHHGKNPYCIDKNYGALIMIWDRVFGTYQAEEEKIAFGTTAEPYKTFDSTTLQFYYYYDSVWTKFKQMQGFGNKMKALFYGPGWAPGKPRCGLLSDIPDVDPFAPLERYDPPIATWKLLYCMVHGFLVALGFYVVTDHPLIRYSHINLMILFIYIILTLTAFGTIFDGRPMAPIVETGRCILFFLFDTYIVSSWMDSSLSPQFRGLTESVFIIIRILHFMSIVLWLMVWLNSTNKRCKETHDKMSLMKEDKYIDSYTLEKNSPTQRGLVIRRMVFLSAGFFSFFAMFFVFSLRYDECTHFLTLNKVDL